MFTESQWQSCRWVGERGQMPPGATATEPFKGSATASATTVPPSEEVEVLIKSCPKVIEHFQTTVEHLMGIHKVQVGGGL